MGVRARPGVRVDDSACGGLGPIGSSGLAAGLRLVSGIWGQGGAAHADGGRCAPPERPTGLGARSIGVPVGWE